MNWGINMKKTPSYWYRLIYKANKNITYVCTFFGYPAKVTEEAEAWS